ncbi:hypothetical protein IAT40_000200 [Kwoniella sp. CBS 6097]
MSTLANMIKKSCPMWPSKPEEKEFRPSTQRDVKACDHAFFAARGGELRLKRDADMVTKLEEAFESGFKADVLATSEVARAMDRLNEVVNEVVTNCETALQTIDFAQFLPTVNKILQEIDNANGTATSRNLVRTVDNISQAGFMYPQQGRTDGDEWQSRAAAEFVPSINKNQVDDSKKDPSAYPTQRFLEQYYKVTAQAALPDLQYALDVGSQKPIPRFLLEIKLPAVLRPEVLETLVEEVGRGEARLNLAWVKTPAKMNSARKDLKAKAGLAVHSSLTTTQTKIVSQVYSEMASMECGLVLFTTGRESLVFQYRGGDLYMSDLIYHFDREQRMSLMQLIIALVILVSHDFDHESYPRPLPMPNPTPPPALASAAASAVPAGTASTPALASSSAPLPADPPP